MHPLRRLLASGSLLASILIVSLVGNSSGQPAKKPASGLRKEANSPGAVIGRVGEMRSGKRAFTNAAEAKANREDLRIFAEYLVFRVTQEEYYKTLNVTKAGELKAATAGTIQDSVLDEVDRYVLKPTVGAKFVAEQADYIKMFGEEIDKAIQKVLPPFAPQYGYMGVGEADTLVGAMRVNAARILAIAAKSGAPAHGPTITKLLTNPKTRPEVLIYGIRAAENLLAAYDPFKLGDKDQAKHTLDDAELYDLILALEGIVEWHRLPWVKEKAEVRADPPPAPAPAAPAPAVGKGKAAPAAPPAPAANTPPAGRLENSPDAPLTRDQLAVLHYYRRAAIKALAQVRFPAVTHRNGKDVVRPLWTLARIAVNDASVSPSTVPGEVAEAVIGLCGYQSFRGIEVDVLVDVIAQGVIRYAVFKTDDPENNSIHWRVTSTRMMTALDQFRKAAPTNSYLTRFAGKIGSFADTVQNDVLGPLERESKTKTPDPESLIGWRSRNPVPALAPFTEVKSLVLKPAPGK